MKDHEIVKKQDLCEKLNMSFEEANELFGTETLQSIQMAQVNGGHINWPLILKRVAEGVALLADLGSIASLLKDFTEESTPPPGIGGVIKKSDGSYSIIVPEGGNISMKADSIIYNGNNGSMHIYNLEITSPAPGQ